MVHDPFGRDGFARVRVMRLPKWQLILIGTIAVTLVLTLVVVAAGAFLLLFPVVLIGGLVLGLVARWRGRAGQSSVPADGRARTRNGEDIVDAEFVILTDRRRDGES